MIYLLHGADDYSKNQFLHELLARFQLPVEYFNSDAVPKLDIFQTFDLFGGNKVFVVRDSLKELFDDRGQKVLMASPHTVIFIEGPLDKRLTLTKAILKDAHVTSKEFSLPDPGVLPSWVISKVEALGATMSMQTAKQLLDRLGISIVPTKSFVPQIYSLQQISTELEKLAIYADGKEIVFEDVLQLVPEKIESQAFDIVNALASKDRQKVIVACNSFFGGAEGGDDKSKLIQLNSLLAEQLRAIAIVQGYESSRSLDAEILTATGWKPGRLFMVRKTAQYFSGSQVLETLEKLENLDVELKTSNTPPRVLLDLILAPLLQ